jgi:hypothetical protein
MRECVVKLSGLAFSAPRVQRFAVDRCTHLAGEPSDIQS